MHMKVWYDWIVIRLHTKGFPLKKGGGLNFNAAFMTDEMNLWVFSSQTDGGEIFHLTAYIIHTMLDTQIKIRHHCCPRNQWRTNQHTPYAAAAISALPSCIDARDVPETAQAVLYYIFFFCFGWIILIQRPSFGLCFILLFHESDNGNEYPIKENNT